MHISKHFQIPPCDLDTVTPCNLNGIMVFRNHMSRICPCFRLVLSDVTTLQKNQTKLVYTFEKYKFRDYWYLHIYMFRIHGRFGQIPPRHRFELFMPL